MNKQLTILVLTHGFVYVGVLEDGGRFDVTLKEARNIRRFGVNRGLGQLSLEGPTVNTEFDPAGDVHANIGSVVHIIDCNMKAWKDK